MRTGDHARMTTPTPGRVWAHVGQPFTPGSDPQPAYDVLILGAGRMGSALALALTERAPHLKTLLIEEGGLPNEDGATILAPGIWTTAHLPAAQHDAAHWTLERLRDLLGDDLQARPYLTLHDGPTPAAGPPATCSPRTRTASRCSTPASSRTPRRTRRTPTGPVPSRRPPHRRHPARHRPPPEHPRHPHPGGRVTLDRLTVTNTHQIVTHETHTLHAPLIVLATGAHAPRRPNTTWASTPATPAHTGRPRTSPRPAPRTRPSCTPAASPCGPSTARTP